MSTRRLRLRRRDQRGAVLVEAALVTPFVMLLFFSIIWGALVFRAYLTVDHAAKVGARQASIADSATDADYQVLQTVKQQVTALNVKAIQSIVIYKASGFNQAPPAACTANGAVTSAANSCNVYGPDDFTTPDSTFLADGYGKAAGFPSSVRASSIQATDGNYIGVYLRVSTNAGTMGIPTPGTVSRFQVLHMENSQY